MSARYEQWDTNPAYERQDPGDAYQCVLCGDLTREEWVSEQQVAMCICEGDACMEDRISELLAAELDAQHYEPMLAKIGALVIPAKGKTDLDALLVNLLEIKLAAMHALNNAADRRKS